MAYSGGGAWTRTNDLRIMSFNKIARQIPGKSRKICNPRATRKAATCERIHPQAADLRTGIEGPTAANLRKLLFLMCSVVLALRRTWAVKCHDRLVAHRSLMRELGDKPPKQEKQHDAAIDGHTIPISSAATEFMRLTPLRCP